TMLPSCLFIHLFYLPVPPPTAPNTPSLHDALPILDRHRPGRRGSIAAPPFPQLVVPPRRGGHPCVQDVCIGPGSGDRTGRRPLRDRKSTRLNSSHVKISYAVFCLKKKIKRFDHNSI